jgi:hypothetical protein
MIVSWKRVMIIIGSLLAVFWYFTEEIIFFSVVLLLGPYKTFFVFNAVFIPLSLFIYHICSSVRASSFVSKVRTWALRKQVDTPKWLRFYLESGKIIAIFVASLVIGPLITATFVYTIGYNSKMAKTLIVISNLFSFSVVIMINCGIIKLVF